MRGVNFAASFTCAVTWVSLLAVVDAAELRLQPQATHAFDYLVLSELGFGYRAATPGNGVAMDAGLPLVSLFHFDLSAVDSSVTAASLEIEHLTNVCCSIDPPRLEIFSIALEPAVLENDIPLDFDFLTGDVNPDYLALRDQLDTGTLLGSSPVLDPLTAPTDLVIRFDAVGIDEINGAAGGSAVLMAQPRTRFEGANMVWDSVQLALTLEPAQEPDVLQAGDADQDLDFDPLDLVQVQIAGKYLTGNVATWGEGDWNGAPGGSPGNPPAGDGLFNQLDIVAALLSGRYQAGPLAAHQSGDSLGFGNVTELGLEISELGREHDVLLGDLTAVGSLPGGSGLGEVDLVPVPEPSALVLAAVALVGLLGYWYGRE